MEENNQIKISLTVYVLIIVISLSLIIGYLIRNLNRDKVEKEEKIFENYDSRFYNLDNEYLL